MAMYKFSNHLMFAIVMKDASLCKQFIERLFPDRKVADIKFPEGITTAVEETIIPGLFSKSVRLDVLFEGNDVYYDIEMQVENEPFIPKRARYYHSSIDTHTLKRGEYYDKLKPCYVIFICLHDPFKCGEPLYSFEMYDKNLGLQMGDENYTIVLDIKCPSGKIPKELESFFSYVSTEEIDEGDEFIKEIHQRVEEANHDAGVIEIMTLDEDMKMRLARVKEALEDAEEALEEAKKHEAFAFDRGLEQGRADGEKAGAEKEKQIIMEKLRASGMSEEQITQILG
jgi:predicted transposase/invertase (TIGR01784 family)